VAEIVDGKAVLVGPDGGLVQVDPKSVDAKVSTGLYKEASPELIAREDQAIAAAEARRKHDEELTSVGAQLETGIKTGLNAVAAPAVWAAQKLGLGDIRNIGMTDSEAAAYHQREAELAAANPIAAGVGEVAGQAVLAGAGGVSAGARALAGRATTSALGRAATGAALEGGALGAAQAMEDPYADAQHVLAGGALGAVLGGAIGAAGHGAESGLSKVFGKSALEESAAREARASIQRDAAGEGEAFWDSMTAKASGAPKPLVEEFGVKNPQARKAAIDAVAHFDRYTEDTAFKMQEITRDLTKSVDDVLEQVRSSTLKREGISKLMGQELEGDILANRTAAGVMKNAGEMYSDTLAGIDRDVLPDFARRRLDATDRWLQKQIEAVGDAPDLSSKHALINETKQDLDKTVRSLRKSAQNANLFHSDAAMVQDVADRMLKVSDELRSTLESPRIWGEKAAAAQREVNAGWHEGGVDAMNAFGDAFERNTGKLDFETGRNVYDADATKFKAAVSGFGRTSGDVAERAMQDYIKNMRRMVDSVDKRYDLTAGKINSLDTAKARLNQLEKLYQDSSKHIGMVNRWKELGSYNQAGNATLTGAILGAGLGAGPVGAIAGGGYSALANPTGAAANLANSILSGSVFQARKRVAGALTNKVTRWIDAGGKAASSARADVTSAAITAFRGKYPTDEKATQARIEQIQKFDPAGISEHASDLPADVAMQAGMVAQKAVDYLRSKIPPYMSAPSLVRSGRAPVMSRPDQIQFARVMGTVLDPTTAAKDLIAGRLTPGQVDALREVYPSIYDDLRVSAVAALGARNSKSEPMPAQVRQQLSMLLDLGDAGDPVLSGQVADRIAQQVASSKAEQAQQAQKQRPPSGGPSKLAQAARSPLESDMQQ
jgi:hypothetical protein